MADISRRPVAKTLVRHIGPLPNWRTQIAAAHHSQYSAKTWTKDTKSSKIYLFGINNGIELDICAYNASQHNLFPNVSNNFEDIYIQFSASGPSRSTTNPASDVQIVSGQVFNTSPIHTFRVESNFEVMTISGMKFLVPYMEVTLTSDSISYTNTYSYASSTGLTDGV